MPESPSSRWKLFFVNSTTKKEYEDFFKDHPDQKRNRKEYEEDVTTNPLYSPIPSRIKPMKSKKWKIFIAGKKAIQE
jgi:hypothetical protein